MLCTFLHTFGYSIKRGRFCKIYKILVRHVIFVVTVGLHPRRIAPMKLKRFYDAYFMVG